MRADGHGHVSVSCRAGFFSETGLPLNSILGNSVSGIRASRKTQTLLGPKKRAGSITPWRYFLSHYWDAARVDPISTTSVIFPAPSLGLRCFVAGCMLFYLHMPIPSVVMH